MSSTNKKIFYLFLISSIIFYIAWELKYFTLVVLGFVLLLILIGLKFSKTRGFLTPVIAVSFAFFFAELVAPVLLPKADTRYDPNSDYTNGYNERIEGFGYRPTSGVHSSVKLTSSGEVIYDVSYSIGADGYRADVASNAYEAYLYGGSFTFGEGLNDNETLSYFLSKNHGVYSKNVGVHGYGLHQALYNIEQGLTFSDENGINILLTAPWHALRSACKPFYAIGTPRYVFVNNRVFLDGVCPGNYFLSLILAKSSVLQFLSPVLVNAEISDSDIDLYLGIIKEIARITKERHGSLVIAYINATEQQLAETRWTNETLLAYLRSTVDSVVNVTLAETREELSSEYYIHELDQHPSAQANIARARLLSNAIRRIQLR